MRKQAYRTDLTDAQWALIKPWVPAPKPGGRPAIHSRRTILNAILYITQTGCPWRLLPHDFPPWSTVYGYFRRWVQSGLWQRIHRRLLRLLRRRGGKSPEPTAAILDSQTVKAGTVQATQGYDAAKKIVGRKRHVLVDTLGCILAVCVTPADEPDRHIAAPLLAIALRGWRRLRVIWADRAYTGSLRDWLRHRWRGRVRLAIVRRRNRTRGFRLQPKRWIVERTFGWLTRARRLVKDYERKPEHSEAFIYLRMIALMLRRLHPPMN